MWVGQAQGCRASHYKTVKASLLSTWRMGSSKDGVKQWAVDLTVVLGWHVGRTAALLLAEGSFSCAHQKCSTWGSW